MPASTTLPPLLHALHAAASQQPDAPALRFDGEVLSHGALQARALALAKRLQQRGVSAGDRVAWLGFSHPNAIVLLLALAHLRAMLVPLNFRLAPAEWRAVLADCTPRLLLHDVAWVDAAQALADCTPVHAMAQWMQGLGDAHTQADHMLASGLADDAPALLVYTSGTTGMPKGAVHRQSHLAANLRMARAAQGITPADRVLTVLPLFHVGGLCIQTLPALSAGAEVTLYPRFDSDAVFDALAQQRPTLTLFVPAVMKALIEHPRWAQADLSCLRAVWAGSSVIPQVLVDAFHARGVPVCNVYGATETGPFSIALGPAHVMSHAGSCGWPVEGVEVQLTHEKNGVGELLIRAPNVVQHYWPDRPATDAQGWFHSGDLGQCAADGSWRIVGRAKDMIISGGENIYPAEIEHLLAAHPAVADCAVLGQDDAQWGEVVVAVVVPRDGAADAAGIEAVLREHLQSRIARYKQPRRWVVAHELPRTALGKVRKDELKRQLQA
ncbi:MAG: class I adenylate-forming enzyme family protein [Burkholderiaceae bacterium]